MGGGGYTYLLSSRRYSSCFRRVHTPFFVRRSPVLQVCLRRDRIAVALEHKTLLYNFADLQQLHQIETLDNPSGLVALSTGKSTVLACPGLHKGQVRLELYDLRRTRFVRAHETCLQRISLTPDGTRLATASERGTLIRVFTTHDGQQLQELRRGSDPAAIYCLAFSMDGRRLAASSDRGTVHVFALPPPDSVEDDDDDYSAGATPLEDKCSSFSSSPIPVGRRGNSGDPNGSSTSSSSSTVAGVAAVGRSGNHTVGCTTSSRGLKNNDQESWPGRSPTSQTPSPGSFQNQNRKWKGLGATLSGILPKYFSSEWSALHYKLPPAEKEGPHVVAFGPDGQEILVASHGGGLIKLYLDTEAGECVKKSYLRYLDLTQRRR